MNHFTPENFYCSLMALLIGRTELLKNRILDAHLAPYGLSASQFKVLIIVTHFGTDTPSELCRHLSLDSGSMTRMLDRLEQKGLLRRTRSDVDRRQVRLALTEDGQRLSGLFPEIGAASMNELLGTLDNHELNTLERILTKVLVAAEDPITLARIAAK